MKKLVLTMFAAAALAAPVAAVPFDFRAEGHRFVGSITQEGDTQVVKGTDITARDDFELRVRNGYVNGKIGVTTVSYPLPKRKPKPATAG